MIRLLVVDIDGVLSLGEAAPFDGTVLQRLAAVNDRARHDPRHLAITLCTGRPAPYVEVLTQVIHGFYPAIYEHGAGLYIPEPYGFKWHPSLTPAVHMQLMQLHSLLYDALVATGRAFFQPGKSASFSLFARPGVPLHEVCSEAARLAHQFGDTFLVEAGATCVNVLVGGLDKAEGVRWLSRETGISLADMAGVGDAQGDMPFMQLLAWAAAPANAHAAVKQIAHYTSPHEDGQGLVDILERIREFMPSVSERSQGEPGQNTLRL
jgi:hydroxymethylpyrimidine pyrophosphatase-like HAD family hydrolase